MPNCGGFPELHRRKENALDYQRTKENTRNSTEGPLALSSGIFPDSADLESLPGLRN